MDQSILPERSKIFSNSLWPEFIVVIQEVNLKSSALVQEFHLAVNRAVCGVL